jgi:hypothetical protein
MCREIHGGVLRSCNGRLRTHPARDSRRHPVSGLDGRVQWVILFETRY